MVEPDPCAPVDGQNPDDEASSRPSGAPKKILYVINEAFFFMAHRLPAARAATNLGYEVHVAAPIDHVWAPKGFTVRHLEEAGFAFHPIPLSRRGTNPIREIRTVISLIRLYAALRPDIVHHLTIKPILYGGFVARLMRVPAVGHSVTGLGQIFVARGVRARLLRAAVVRAYRFATGHSNCRVLVENPDDEAQLSNIGAVPADRIVVIKGTGVSMKEFEPTPDRGGVPLVILAARLIWEKGIEDFVEAAKSLRASRVEARFALVGDSQPSNPRSVPERQLLDWTRDGVIEWWGRREDMAAVYAESHIVCLPSRYGEGVPRSLIEAAACSRPVVTTDAPGCREIVREGENGFLVPVGDVPALVAALRRLIEDRGLRIQMGLRARAIAKAEFSDTKVVQRTSSVYEELASRMR